jgi:hypothetical protein
MKSRWITSTGRLVAVAWLDLFGIFILRVAAMIGKLTGKERFFSVWVTVRHPNGRIEQEQKSSTACAIIDNLKEPKGIFAGPEYREWQVISIRVSIWEI